MSYYIMLVVGVYACILVGKRIYREKKSERERQERAHYLRDNVTEEQLFALFKNWKAVLQNGDELLKFDGSECLPLLARLDYFDLAWVIWVRSKSTYFFTIKAYASSVSNNLSLDNESLKLERKEKVLSMLIDKKRLDLIEVAGFVQKDA